MDTVVNDTLARMRIRRPEAVQQAQAWLLQAATAMRTPTVEALLDAARPRPLTESDIERICDQVFVKPGTRAVRARPASAGAVRIPCPDPAVALSIYTNMRTLLTQQLKTESVTPMAHTALVEVLQKRFAKALVTAGTPVGVRCGEALGGPVTQLALNSFHQSGAGKNLSSGIEVLKALLNMSVPNVTNCFVHFKNKTLTKRDVLGLRTELVAVPMRSLIVGTDIRLAERTDAGLLDPVEFPDDAPWVLWAQTADPDLAQFFRTPDYHSAWYLRVQLNVNKLVQYGITMEDVRAAMGLSAAVHAILGPMHLGTMYVFVSSAQVMVRLKLEEDPEGRLAVSYLNSVVVGALEGLTFRGLKGITDLFPAEVDVSTVVAEQAPASTQGVWNVILHAGKVTTTGITAPQVKTALDAAGLPTRVLGPLALEVTSASKPIDVFNQRVAAESDKVTAARRAALRAVAEQRDPGARAEYVPDGPLMKASKYVYGETNGSALLQLLMHPLVDAYYTYSNEVHVVYELYGIEAARNLWLLMFHQAVENSGEYVDARHLIMVADILFNLGQPVSVSSSGISRQKNSVLHMLTVERAMDYVTGVAAMGAREPANTTSGAIMLGNQIESGTNFALQILPLSPEELDEAKQAMEKLLTKRTEEGPTAPKPVSADALASVLDMFDDVPEPGDALRPAEPPVPPPLEPPVPPSAPAPAPVGTAPPPLASHFETRPVVSGMVLSSVEKLQGNVPTLPQGMEVLLTYQKVPGQRKTLPRLVPPKIALSTDASGSTTFAFDPRAPLPSVPVPLLPQKQRTVVSVRVPAQTPKVSGASRPSASGLPAPVDTSVWLAFMSQTI